MYRDISEMIHLPVNRELRLHTAYELLVVADEN